MNSGIKYIRKILILRGYSNFLYYVNGTGKGTETKWNPSEVFGSIKRSLAIYYSYIHNMQVLYTHTEALHVKFNLNIICKKLTMSSYLSIFIWFSSGTITFLGYHYTNLTFVRE